MKKYDIQLVHDERYNIITIDEVEYKKIVQKLSGSFPTIGSFIEIKDENGKLHVVLKSNINSIHPEKIYHPIGSSWDDD